MIKLAPILVVVTVLFGCGQKPAGLPVLYVVPTGYRGTFTISLDAVRGVPVPTSNGQSVVTIPSSGSLTVRTFDFIHGRHVVSAQYANGEPVLDRDRDENVALRIVGRSNQNPDAMVFMIGTRKEADDAFTKY